MSDLRGIDDPAQDQDVTGDPAPPPDNSLLNDFLQARALAQHVNVMARLDAFAAAQDAATADASDDGGIRVRWGTDDPSAPAGSSRHGAVAALGACSAAPGSVPPDGASQAASPNSLGLARPIGLPSEPTTNSGSGPVQSAVPEAAAGREAGVALAPDPQQNSGP